VHYTYTQYLERIVIELIDCLLWKPNLRVIPSCSW
jgi:hypothetical protein